jgi:hypothetical protein
MGLLTVAALTSLVCYGATGASAIGEVGEQEDITVILGCDNEGIGSANPGACFPTEFVLTSGRTRIAGITITDGTFI